VEHERWGTPVASYVAGLPPDARPLDRGKPRDEDTEGGSQPADKSLINRRLSLHSQPCAAMAFLADGELAEQALNRASPLDREHKRLESVVGSAQTLWALAGRNGQRIDNIDALSRFGDLNHPTSEAHAGIFLPAQQRRSGETPCADR
jgi:hypothetical protein